MDNNAETRVENRLHPLPPPVAMLNGSGKVGVTAVPTEHCNWGEGGGAFSDFQRQIPLFFSNIYVHDCL